MPAKSLFVSKTFWVNLFAAIALAVQQFLTGFPIEAEWQVAILTLCNVVLRLFTSQPVTIRPPNDPDIPAAPAVGGDGRDLANSVTRPVHVLLVAGLAAQLLSCAGATVRCDDPTLVLRDATAAHHTRLVIECGGQEVASQEVDLGELAGSQRCQDPSLVLRGQDAAGLSRVELVCGGQVLAEFRLDLRHFAPLRVPVQPAAVPEAPAVEEPTGAASDAEADTPDACSGEVR